MKRLFAFLPILIAVLWTTTAVAQYDDLYFNPKKDADFLTTKQKTTTSQSADPGYIYNSNDDYYYDEDDYRDEGRSSSGQYNDDAYGYDDNYDYYYTSRIRRFHSPYVGFGYYDPFYVDLYYYDPFFAPTTTVLIYDSYWYGNYYYPPAYYRPNFSLSIGFSWGWGGFYTGWGYNPWYNPWGWGYNHWHGYPGFGYPGYGYGGCPSYYYPPSWGHDNHYYNDNVHYGPRMSGTTRTERGSVRLVDDPGGRVTPGTQQPAQVQKAQADRTTPKDPSGVTEVSPAPVAGREGLQTEMPPREQQAVKETTPRQDNPVVQQTPPKRENQTVQATPSRDWIMPTPPRQQVERPTSTTREREQYSPTPRVNQQPPVKREQPAPQRTQPSQREDNRSRDYRSNDRTSSPPPSYNRPNNDTRNRSYEQPRSNNNKPSYQEPPRSNNNSRSYEAPRSNSNSGGNSRSYQSGGSNRSSSGGNNSSSGSGGSSRSNSSNNSGRRGN